MAYFKERLSELSRECGKTSKELAQVLGYKDSAIRRWMTSECCPKLSTLVRFADFFGCSIEFLAGRTDKQLEFAVKTRQPFFKRLCEIMKMKGVSTYRLDKETQVKHIYLNRWRHGGEPLLSTLIILSDYLGCTLDQLAGRESIR